MTWTETSDVEQWLAATADLLLSEPGRHTIALTLAEHARAGAVGIRFAWWDEGDGDVTGAAIWQAPHPALVCVATDAALADLGALWSPTSVAGETAVAVQAAILLAAGRPVRLLRAERAFALNRLQVGTAQGKARVAGSADLPRVTDWFSAFLHEAGLPCPDDLQRDVDGRLRRHGVLLWEVDGAPVSLAGHQPLAFGAIRVGPVFTPVEHRGRGYGGAVTAAVTQHALDLGAHEVVLFTDLANATANRLYPRLGYVPVRDRAVLEIWSG